MSPAKNREAVSDKVLCKTCGREASVSSGSLTPELVAMFLAAHEGHEIERWAAK